jgi:hypothetical protein
MSGKILQSIGYCIFRPDNAVNKIKTKDLTKGSKVLRLLLYYFDDLFGPPAKNILERKSIIHSRSANDLLRMKRMSMQSSNSISALHSANQSESSETKPKKDTATSTRCQVGAALLQRMSTALSAPERVHLRLS